MSISQQFARMLRRIKPDPDRCPSCGSESSAGLCAYCGHRPDSVVMAELDPGPPLRRPWNARGTGAGPKAVDKLREHMGRGVDRALAAILRVGRAVDRVLYVIRVIEYVLLGRTALYLIDPEGEPRLVVDLRRRWAPTQEMPDAPAGFRPTGRIVVTTAKDPT